MKLLSPPTAGSIYINQAQELQSFLDLKNFLERLLQTQSQQNVALGGVTEQLNLMQRTQKEIIASIQSAGSNTALLPAVTEAELLHVQQKIGAGNVINAEPLCAAEAVAVYSDAVAAAGRVSSNSVQEETWRRRLNSFAEFKSWFDFTMDAREIEKTVMDATPSDIVVYHEAHWVKNHGETVLDGVLWPAPSSLENNFCMLSAIFVKHGKVGEYDPARQLGNPVQSAVVRSYKQGYAQQLRSLGYATTSARHLSGEKYLHVMQTMSKQQQQKRAALNWGDKKAVVRFLIVERDLLALCGAWECFLRGHDMGKLTCFDIQDGNGVALIPFMLQHPMLKIPTGHTYQIAPQGIKTVQQRRAGVIRLQAKNEKQAHLCFLRRLQHYSFLLMCGQLSSSQFLFRPETTNHQDFKDSALDSSALNKRLQFHLEQLGIFENETLHGVRRGGMQNGVANGATKAAVGEKALQKTPAVTDIYLDTSRETNGPQRKKNSRKTGLGRFKPY